jgi:hypothetical protein
MPAICAENKKVRGTRGVKHFLTLLKLADRRLVQFNHAKMRDKEREQPCFSGARTLQLATGQVQLRRHARQRVSSLADFLTYFMVPCRLFNSCSGEAESIAEQIMTLSYFPNRQQNAIRK